MSMLTADGIRAAALERLEAGDRNRCNEGHRLHTDGVLRGLIWALTGDDPGTYLTKDIERVCQLLGIHAERKGDRIFYETRV